MLKTHNWHLCPILLLRRPEGCFPWAKWFLAPSGALHPIITAHKLSLQETLPTISSFPSIASELQSQLHSVWTACWPAKPRITTPRSKQEASLCLLYICLSHGQFYPSRLTATDIVNMLQFGDYPVSRGQEEEAKQKHEPHPKAWFSKPWVNSG